MISLNEISCKGEIIVTVPMQEKLQVEFIAIFALDPFPFITVIYEHIYLHMNADISFKFNMQIHEKQVSDDDDENDNEDYDDNGKISFV